MGYNNEEEVQERVYEHYKIVKDMGYEIFFVAHQGSWNYGLGYEGSDVDTKAVIIPSFEDIVYNREPVSYTKVLDNNEHIDIKDIRVMFENFKKQNINFLEILFSKFYVVNDNYADDYWRLIRNNELIAHFNTNQAIRCMAGMSMEKLKALCHPYPSIKDKIEKYNYDNKQLHHILRMNDFIKRYCEGESFKDCLIPTNSEYLLEIKKTFMPVEEAVKLANKTDEETKNIKDKYVTEEDKINQNALDVLNLVKYNVLREKFANDILFKRRNSNEVK